MAGSKIGGAKAALTNKTKYGSDYYARIGAMGGKLGTTGGFGQGEKGRALARVAGSKGGQISRRRPSEEGR